MAACTATMEFRIREAPRSPPHLCQLFVISGENLPTIQSVLNHKSLAPTSLYARLNTKGQTAHSKRRPIGCAVS